MLRTRARRLLSVSTALATVAAYAGLSASAPAARAADPATAGLISLVDGLQGFLPGVGQGGALAAPLPTTGLVPGGPAGLGLGDLLTQARTTRLGGPTFDGAGTVQQLVDRINSGASDGAIADGRTVQFSASRTTAGPVETVTLSFTATKTVASAPLDLSDDDPDLDIASAGGVSVALTLTGSLILNAHTGTGEAWITRTGSTPSLALSATGSIPDVTAVQAGLGILGVRLKAGSTYTYAASVGTSWQDPDNDGRLAFEEPGGASGDGELSAPGAATGLVSAALTSGSLSASLALEARPSTAIDLGQVDVTVGVSAPDLLAAAPQLTVTSGTLSSVQDFLRLSPRDLAQGLAQAAAAVVNLQQSTGAQLPWLRGSVADAVGAVDAVAAFLDRTVPEPSAASAKPGLPSFVSLQDFLEALEKAGTPADLAGQLPGGALIDVTQALYTAGRHEVALGIGITKASPGTAVPLNPMTGSLDGDATYTDTTLTDPGRNFTAVDGGAASLIGRQVSVGAARAVIKQVGPATDTLQLDPTPFGATPPPSLWAGGTPTDNQPYSIAANDPKTGLVELGDALKATGGIGAANAEVARAEVKASYALTLPLVLNLEPASTADCNYGAPGTGCPASITDGSGGTRIVTSTPETADRIQIRTGTGPATVPVLSARAEISTAVDVSATVGFVEVAVGGTLRLCPPTDGDTCTGTPTGAPTIALGVRPQGSGAGADAQGDVPLPRFVGNLAAALKAGNISGIVDFAVAGEASADLTVTVPGAPAFFGPPTGATVGLRMPDITAPGAVSVTAPALDALKSLDVDPNNPLALFGGVLGTLRALQTALSAVPGGTAALDREIPLVGRSVSDLIGDGPSGAGSGVTYGATPVGGTSSTVTDAEQSFTAAHVGRRLVVGTKTVAVVGVPNATTLVVKPPLTPAGAPALPAGTPYVMDGELQGLINLLDAAPSASLQDLLGLAGQKLGTSAPAFSVEQDGGTKVLRLALDWQRGFRQETPLAFDFDLGGARSLVGAQGEGLLEVDVDGRVKVVLRLPLTAAAVADPAGSLTVDAGESLIEAGFAVDTPGLRLRANVGPFNLALGKPAPADAGTVLKAALQATMRSSATGNVGLAAFLGGLGVTLDGGDLSCPGAPAGEDIAFCAVLPAYLNGDPINTDEAKNAFAVRLPLGSDLASTFAFGGTLSDGTPKFVAPDGLAAKFTSAALDLFSFENGFLEYLRFLEQAMGAASYDGKLPLIGKDLQAGSDFIAGLRGDIEEAFGGAVPDAPTAGAIRTFFRDTVEPLLPATGLTVGLACSNPMRAPTPTAEKVGTGSGTDYTYKVLAYTTVDGETVEGKHSVATVTRNHVAPLTADERIEVRWPEVPGADGYKVLVKVGTEPYKLLADTGDSESYDHTGAQPTGDAYPDSGAEPCPDSTPADEVSGFTVTLDLGRGMPRADVGCRALQSGDPGFGTSAAADQACLTAQLPLDLGIPGLSLKATDATGRVTGSLGWRLHLKLEVSRVKGFVVHTQDSGLPELSLGASLDVPDVEAQLAFLKIASTNNKATPEFAGMVAVDLRAAGDAVCLSTCTADDSKVLPLADLVSGDLGRLVTAGLSARVDIDWHLDAGIDPSVPGLEADFELLWTWGTRTATGDVATTAAPGDNDGLTRLGFYDVAVDPGTFLGNTIGKIVKQVVDVLKPVQPIIDTIFAPVPVISDLSTAVGGDEVTIASLASTFSTIAGGPKLDGFLTVVKQIRDLVKALSAECPDNPGTACVRVGDVSLNPDKAVTTDANPATAKSLIQAAVPHVDPDGKSLLQRLDETRAGYTPTGVGLQNTGHSSANPGFTFPALQDPSKLLGLLVGQDVELAAFDSGPLTLGFQFQQSYGPVYAPPPVNVVISGGASVSLRIAAGFDTYGIRTAVESGKPTVGILDSLYFKTVDAAGTPIPVVEFSGFLAAGASVSAVVIEVGIIGGIKLTVGFFWNDPNNDGKFRFGEFLTAALSNPICLFNVGGELSLFIKVFITLGVSPFSVSFDFTLVELTLLSFNVKPNCEPPPPRLGGTTGSTLYLFAGALGKGGERGDPFWKNNNNAEETWVVRQVKADPGAGIPNDRVAVSALGITEVFDDTDGRITSVVLDGRDYAGNLKVMFQGGSKAQPFTKDTYVATGSGKDVVRTGEGNAWVDSGDGDDQVTTLDRTDLSVDVASAAKAVVAGGAGTDSLTVGNGADTVLGDGVVPWVTNGAGVTVRSADDPDQPGDQSVDVSLADTIAPQAPTVVPATVAVGTQGADQIAAGLGGSVIWGHGGDDKIGTANDNPQVGLSGIKGTPAEAKYRARKNTIVGGAGSDRIKSGSAGDEIYTGALQVIDGTGFGSGDAATDTNTVDTGEGSDTVYGSNAVDNIATHSTAAQTATVFGGDAADVVTGGQGTDALFGGPGNDYLVAQEATVSGDEPLKDQLGDARRVTVSGTPVTVEKTLVGGGGSDRIYGANGPSKIWGDGQTDTCVVQAAPVSEEYQEDPVTDGPESGRDAPDLILGGAGVDVVEAGGGNDHVYTYGAGDRACGSTGEDRLYGGADGDLVFGGSGGDRLYGEGGDDQLYAGKGDDDAYGDSGSDRLQGNAGADFLTGGSEADLVIGGTSAAGRDDGADRLSGDTGTDWLVGDNADADTLAGLPYPTDLALQPAGKGGADDIRGGDQDDTAFGGLADDAVLGGGGDDVLEGNSAADTVRGEAGKDDLVGGSSRPASGTTGFPDGGDHLFGGLEDDVLAGDNALISKAGTPTSPLTQGRSITERRIVLHDQGDGPATGLSGDDDLHGDTQTDVLLGQRGTDVVEAGDGHDYAEGGQGSDTVTGGQGKDDLVGGSYDVVSGSGQEATGQLDAGDLVDGGADDDVVAGDNAQVLRVGTASPLTKNRGSISPRSITLLDQTHVPTPVPDTDATLVHRSGRDVLNGDGEADVLLGQRHADVVHGDDGDDYAEGGQDGDTVHGDGGQDDLVGGSYDVLSGTGAGRVGQLDAGDTIWGGEDGDVVLGDNGAAHRDGTTSTLTKSRGITERVLQPYDLVASGYRSTTHGGDLVRTESGNDVVLAQAGDDRVLTGPMQDYAEGGQDADWVEGGAASDDLVGGSSSTDSGTGATALGQDDGGDVLAGQSGDDLVVGDNALVTRVAPFNPLTERVGLAGEYVEKRSLQLLDLSTSGDVLSLPSQAGTPGRDRWGADLLSGHEGVDVLLGQDGGDAVSGGGHGDYAEGQGGADRVWGDATLSAAGVALPAVTWPGAATADWDADTGPHGQDDLIGGKSQQGFRDSGDQIHGDGESDYVTADNGTMVRKVTGTPGSLKDTVYALRYGTPAATDAVVRYAPTTPGSPPSTRWCATRPTGQAATCEPAGAFGGDQVWGDGGDDFLYGQDGDDTVMAGAGDDDAYGELGNDTLFGEDGDDAVLGDRGGVRDVRETGSASRTSTVQAPPAETYVSRRAGSVSRVTDLLHDVNGDVFVGSGAGSKMVYDGVAFGGNDRIRGGAGADDLHGGTGDDLVNGDSGGDALFGAGGADVLWSGKGCDATLDAAAADCRTGGVFDPTARGTNDRMVDHVFAGKGGYTGPSVANGGTGADVVDWYPRGSYNGGAGCTTNAWPVDLAGGTVTLDPCAWFEMTDRTDADATNDQHHQGTDWIYGGWDRDVMQADVAANGPNPGDRLLDWTGAYNLYSHCNAAYGGFNDVREFSPSMQTFLQEWAFGAGAGQVLGDVTAKGTSAFEELALVYQADIKTRGAGPAYPSTPGHFDDPNACQG